jgi:hypothetical protein
LIRSVAKRKLLCSAIFASRPSPKINPIFWSGAIDSTVTRTWNGGLLMRIFVIAALATLLALSAPARGAQFQVENGSYFVLADFGPNGHILGTVSFQIASGGTLIPGSATDPLNGPYWGYSINVVANRFGRVVDGRFCIRQSQPQMKWSVRARHRNVIDPLGRPLPKVNPLSFAGSD